MAGTKGMTERAFAHQLRALRASRFDLGIKLEGASALERRDGQTFNDLMRVTPYLKYRNMKGYHIYVRPGATEPCVLLDDLTVKQLIRMEDDGLRCACVVRTSDFNYQAWIRLAVASLEPDLATCLGEVLAERYEADLASKDFRHFGRAVGFTNVKPEHQLESGLFPFVRLEEARGVSTSNTQELISQARERLQIKEAARVARYEAYMARASDGGADASEAFAQAVAFVFEQYKGATDPSRADASAVRHLLVLGYSIGSIEQAMMFSEDIQARRPKTHVDYIERTIRWAIGTVRHGGQA